MEWTKDGLNRLQLNSALLDTKSLTSSIVIWRNDQCTKNCNINNHKILSAVPYLGFGKKGLWRAWSTSL